MRWQGNEESDNVEDRRGIGPTGAVLGGGGALIILIVGLLFGLNPQQVNQLIQQQGGANPNGNAAAPANLTPKQVEQREFLKTVLRFTEVVWDEQFRKLGKQYVKPHMVLFSNQVETGCGTAPSAVGPFYCPEDQIVYLDPTFFEELQGKLGGSKGEFSQAYVVAHEVGHHVQKLLGYSDIVDRHRQAPDSHEWSVRLELQADYLAGVWAYYGQEKFHFIEPGDVESAITSANAIGDDRLQKRAGGFVSPEKYTHGTSEQRVRWFSRGLKTGSMEALPSIFEMPYKNL